MSAAARQPSLLMPTAPDEAFSPLTLSRARDMVGGRLSSDWHADVLILRVVTHSAQVRAGDLFVPLDGHTTRGCMHYREAMARGAAALLVETTDPRPDHFPSLICENKRKSGAEIMNAMLGDPLSGLSFVGITGTKGKTSTLAMLRAEMEFVGKTPLTVGTLGIGAADGMTPLVNTTPDLFFLLPHFARYVRGGGRTVLCEVSSQALADRRLEGAHIPLAVFTGFFRDHIGPREHASLADYYGAKRRLFTDYSVKTAIAPCESPYSRDITRGVSRRLFASLREPSDLSFIPIRTDPSATRFSYRDHSYTLSVGGLAQLSNAALATLAATELLHLPPEAFLPALSDVYIAGRMECYRLGDATVIIDYAHNGESLRAAALASRPLCRCRMITLFGSVGGRAECRRRDLVEAAEEVADLVILTEDDTDTEPREDILSEMLSYARDASVFVCIPDRAEAIRHACSISRPGDTVLLLGKGHEQFLVRGGLRIPFCEREILLSLGATPLANPSHRI